MPENAHKNGKKRASHPQPIDAQLNRKEVKNVYNTLSGLYDIWGKLAESRARNQALAMADIKDGQHILEVAVGTGIAFREVVKKNPNGMNIGIDISEGMLAKAKKRLRKINGNYELKIADAFNLPYPQNFFDIVLNHYMFDLIPFEEMNKILANFYRVLKPDGVIILVNMTEGISSGSKIYQWIYRISPKLFGGCRPVKMADRLTSQGFRISHRKYVEQLFFPSEIIIAAKKIS